MNQYIWRNSNEENIETVVDIDETLNSTMEPLRSGQLPVWRKSVCYNDVPDIMEVLEYPRWRTTKA